MENWLLAQVERLRRIEGGLNLIPGHSGDGLGSSFEDLGLPLSDLSGPSFWALGAGLHPLSDPSEIPLDLGGMPHVGLGLFRWDALWDLS